MTSSSGSVRGLKRYLKTDFLGEGQFATVFKAKDVLDPDPDTVVAVKKIKLGSSAEAKDGIHRTALREIKLLQELSHENVIGMRDVFGTGSNVAIVMDFMDTDLEVIIKDTSIILTPAHIKTYTLQTLKGLEYLHQNWILHRDLKPNNLLVDRHGTVKLGDFGLAKSFGSPNRVYTHIVVTRWYRAPELLLGARMYGTGIDIWAVGCILAEMLLRTPFLPGDTDLDQLSKIFQALGTPTEQVWPGHRELPDYVQFKEFVATPLEDIFTAASSDLLALLAKCFHLDPNKRCTCSQALQMSYFTKNQPYPGMLTTFLATLDRKPLSAPPSSLPLPESVRVKYMEPTEAAAVKAAKRKNPRLQGIESSGLKKKLF